MKDKPPDEFNSLMEASVYAKTCRQAIFLAIQKGKLKAEKKVIKNKRGAIRPQWIVQRKDLDEYRLSKYNTEKRVVDGEKLFDIEMNRWSVTHAAKALSYVLRRPFYTHQIYYLIRIGRVRALRKGANLVIDREEILKIYEKEIKDQEKQLTFA